MRSAWLALGDAHIARRSHAHCKSGRRGSWLKSSPSVRIRLYAHDHMKCGWPMGVPKPPGHARRIACFPTRRLRPAQRILVGAHLRHGCTPGSCHHWKLCRILPFLPAPRCREPRVHAPAPVRRRTQGAARRYGVRTRPGTKRHAGQGRTTLQPAPRASRKCRNAAGERASARRRRAGNRASSTHSSQQTGRWRARHATGDVFRRLVSRALAKGWANTFDKATRPFQFALQASAGTDALTTHVLVALDQAQTRCWCHWMGTAPTTRSCAPPV